MQTGVGRESRTKGGGGGRGGGGGGGDAGEGKIEERVIAFAAAMKCNRDQESSAKGRAQQKSGIGQILVGFGGARERDVKGMFLNAASRAYVVLMSKSVATP